MKKDCSECKHFDVFHTSRVCHDCKPWGSSTDLISRAELNDCVEAWYEEMGVDLHGIYNKQLAKIVKEKDEDDLVLDFHSLVASINALTSADAVEVVRCKDCRFAMVRTKEEMNKPIKPQPILCEWLCIGVENDAYCSHGERREP